MCLKFKENAWVSFGYCWKCHMNPKLLYLATQLHPFHGFMMCPSDTLKLHLENNTCIGTVLSLCLHYLRATATTLYHLLWFHGLNGPVCFDWVICVYHNLPMFPDHLCCWTSLSNSKCNYFSSFFVLHSFKNGILKQNKIFLLPWYVCWSVLV